MTSVSPCPLATNVAAVSFVGRRVGSPGQVLAGGLLYTAGRAVAYTALGVLLVASLLSAPALSLALQKHMNRILGPLLILVGMVLLGLLPLRLPGAGSGAWGRRRAGSAGVWGAGALGVLFALSFCPVSAALFFGSLIPLAVKQESPLLLPALYGAGTGLPVLAFALATALGAKSLGGAFRRVAAVERWARGVTGAIFIAVGIRYCLVHVFRVLG
jgi:cytochrome c biogenesis protein CcdA